MTLSTLRDSNAIIFECLSGSKAYGLDIPTSDTDIKGVFVLPKQQFYGLTYTPQVNNPTNDVVYYELGRFMELLGVNNPNILELLATPEEAILKKSSQLARIDISRVLSKRCRHTFGGFAVSQIRKAKGLNKKIVNPVERKRKTPLDFCYVNYGSGSLPVTAFLMKKGWRQEDCGLTNIPHMKDIYGLYHAPDETYAGIIKNERSNELALSSIPRGEEQVALLYFNKDGYSTYCKDYREYWAWVENRNEARYQDTKSHGKNYDAKNMMHTFRLLHMAIEIAREGRIRVRRPDRKFLLKVRSGAYEYEDLVRRAEEKQVEMEEAFAASTLPAQPDRDYIEEMTVGLRESFYG